MSRLKSGWQALIFLLIIITTLGFSQNSISGPLPIDEAFAVTAWAPDSKSVMVRFDIAPSYYLYRDKFHFRVIKGNVKLAEPEFPPPIIKNNAILGDYSAYQDQIQIRIPIISASDSSFQLQIKFQGCSESGYCYPPAERIQTVGPIYPRAETIGLADAPNLIPLSRWVSFFLWGVLISLTPCVLPMIPILSAMIIGKEKINHARSFAISLAYVLGMAISYAAVGILLGKLGSNLQAYLQKPWIIILFSLVFILMALSLFGFYAVQLPEKLRAAMSRLTNRQRRGSLWGAAVMGCLSTLILSPCATPVLVGILGYISTSGNAAVGGLALFVVAIGMGLPLLLVGLLGSRILPKPGPWMQIVEKGLGVILLALAIWMLGRVFSPQVIMWAWAVLAIGMAIFMKTFCSVAGLSQRISKICGIVIFIYGILLIIGAMQGATDPWRPLFNKTTRSPIVEPNFIKVKTVADLANQLKKASGKLVLLDFYADWCVACKLMDQDVFANPKVQQKLTGIILLRADVTANDAEDKQLLKAFNVVAPPTILWFDRDQKEIEQMRIIGEISSTDFIKRIDSVKSWPELPR